MKKSLLTDFDYKKLLENVVFKESLYLSSPELYTQLLKWDDGSMDEPRKIERLQFSLLKYLTRISTRCTPFGLFASCTLGSFENKTNIQLSPISEYKRKTRFDMVYLSILSQNLVKEARVRDHLKFYPNSSMYKVGNQYRYVEYSLNKNSREYSLEGFANSSYLEKILETAKRGKTIVELSSIIEVENKEIAFQDAYDFVEVLISNQILVSELDLTITGKDYFKKLLNKISRIPNCKGIYDVLAYQFNELQKFDSRIGNNPEDYKNILKSVNNTVGDIDVQYMFQTDCYSKSNQNTLNSEIKAQLKRAIVIFNKITIPEENPNITQFIKKYKERFGLKKVSLSLALDIDLGVGYGKSIDDDSSLLDCLTLQATEKKYKKIIWSKKDDLLQRKIISAAKNNDYVIRLTEEDFIGFSTNWEDLPDTFSSIIEVYNSNENKKVYIDGIGGSSAVNLLGRFCSNDEKLLRHVKGVIKVEEEINTDKILAEIVHLPQTRTGNILQRPILRNYEIPYLGKSDLEIERQISINDILISIENNTIILWSKKLKKVILPYLSNAHNYSLKALPVYQFLCELQTQNKRSSIGFKWNSIFLNHVFLPRVEYENLIFSKAQWYVEVKRFKELFEKDFSLKKNSRWKLELQMPSFVELCDGDNKLLINLENESSVKMLFSIVKNRKNFKLQEFLFCDDETVKKGKEFYCNQFVVSFFNNKKLQALRNENHN